MDVWGTSPLKYPHSFFSEFTYLKFFTRTAAVLGYNYQSTVAGLLSVAYLGFQKGGTPPSPSSSPLPFLFPLPFSPSSPPSLFPSLPSLPFLSPPLTFPSPFPCLSPFPPLPSLPLEVGPLKSSSEVWGSAVSSPVGSEAEPQRKSNVAHFNLKMWHLVAKILIIFLRLNWPNFMHFMIKIRFATYTSTHQCHSFTDVVNS